MLLRLRPLCVGLIVPVALPALAACPPQWLYGPSQGLTGVDDSVLAVTTWDPDGPAGQPELLVAGGSFKVAGHIEANYIAAWDGREWRPMGTGMNYSVRALTVYKGDLIAGGSFTTAGGEACYSIARWDGQRWWPLGRGMNDAVYALTVHNGELIAGG